MKTRLTIFLLLTCELCFGQNLVPNGDFELYYSCPTNVAQIDSAMFWINPATAIIGVSGSPDYYNQCNNSSNSVDVPNNFIGFQNARSGVAYSGIYLWSIFYTYREYIEVLLTSPLTEGTCYDFKMYVNLAEKVKYTTDALGVYFSDTVIRGVNNWYQLPFTPQIINTTGDILDTVNWVLIAGTYKAKGGESYLIIGNFNDSLNTTATLVNSQGIFDHAYIYVDDVSLVQVPPCTVDIAERNRKAELQVNPNPFSTQLTCSFADNVPSTVSLYNFLGQQVLQQTFTNSTTINTEQLADGIYFYELRSNKGTLKTGKLVKQ